MYKLYGFGKVFPHRLLFSSFLLSAMLGTPSYAKQENIPLFAVIPGVVSHAPVGEVSMQIAQLIVPQTTVGENGDEASSLGTFSSSVTAPVVLKEIHIEGNNRISDGKILDFFQNLKIGDTVNSSLVNKGLRQLFQSGLFSNFQADLTPEGTLKIKVTESPVIGRVAFEGNSALKDDALEITVLSKSRHAYSVSGVDQDVRRIQAAYRQSGRYGAVVKPVIIPRDQNRIDVVFEINEGEKTRIESINFIGNSFASDGTLKDEMLSKISNIFSLVFGGDTYDPDKLSFDTENIRNYYLRNGFADIQVTSASSELDPEMKGFHITISVEEGKRYSFGEIATETQIPEVNTDRAYAEAIEIKTEDIFDNTKIQTAIVALENAVQAQGIPFVRVAPQVKKNLEDQTIDLNFVILPGPKRYIETININNNVRTLDYVIRRELTLAEGDPISIEKIHQSEERLLALGFFKKIDITRRQGTNANDVVLDVNVEEKSTGSINAGIGLSTSSGAFAQFGIAENNFLGRGQTLSAQIKIGKRSGDYQLGFVEPRFLDRDLSAGVNIYRLTNDSSTSRKYDYKNTGLDFSFSHVLFPKLTHRFGVGFSRTTIDNVSSTASIITKGQEGRSNRFTISQGLTYSTLNSASSPTEGYFVSGNLDWTGLFGKYKSLKALLSSGTYFAFSEEVVLGIRGELGYLKGLSGTSTLISDNYSLGGENNFRGFESAGIGPRIAGTKESLGGQRMMKGSVNLRFPSGLPKHVGLKLVAFTDFGLVSNHGFSNTTGVEINNSNKLRVSAGIGAEFGSQIPISVYFAKALRKETWDKTESFVISFGTSF